MSSLVIVDYNKIGSGVRLPRGNLLEVDVINRNLSIFLNGTRDKNIKFNKDKTHAWLQIEHNGKTFIFNANDSNIFTREQLYRIDGTPANLEYGRPMMERNIALSFTQPESKDGVCLASTVAMKRVYERLEWDAFVKWTLKATNKMITDELRKPLK